MTATKPHRGFLGLRLFLAFLGLVVLGLNTQEIVQTEKHYNSMTPEQRAELDIDSSFREDYAKLLTPCLGLILMSLILAAGRPRLNNQRLHTVFRVAFSLALAAGLVYFPADQMDWVVQSTKRLEARHPSLAGKDHPFTFETRYLCQYHFASYNEDYMRDCRIRLSRDMLSIISAFLVVVELVVAGVVGEIGTR